MIARCQRLNNSSERYKPAALLPADLCGKARIREAQMRKQLSALRDGIASIEVRAL